MTQIYDFSVVHDSISWLLQFMFPFYDFCSSRLYFRISAAHGSIKLVPFLMIAVIHDYFITSSAYNCILWLLKVCFCSLLLTIWLFNDLCSLWILFYDLPKPWPATGKTFPVRNPVVHVVWPLRWLGSCQTGWARSTMKIETDMCGAHIQVILIHAIFLLLTAHILIVAQYLIYM